MTSLDFKDNISTIPRLQNCICLYFHLNIHSRSSVTGCKASGKIYVNHISRKSCGEKISKQWSRSVLLIHRITHNLQPTQLILPRVAGPIRATQSAQVIGFWNRFSKTSHWSHQTLFKERNKLQPNAIQFRYNLKDYIVSVWRAFANDLKSKNMYDILLSLTSWENWNGLVHH